MSEGALPAEIIEPRLPRLSPAEADELLSRVGSLANVRGDLPSGLRASAASCDSSALARALHHVADQVELGRSPESILNDADWGLPPHLAGLIAAATTSGDCGAVLSEIISLRETIDDAWRETRSALAYPLVLVLLTAAVLVFLTNFVVPQLIAFYSEFDLPLPASTAALSWFASTGQWLVAAWLVVLVVLAIGLRLLGPWPLFCRARASLPVIGKIFVWTGVVEALRLVRLLVQHGLPLADAWRLAAAGVRDGYVADVATRIAKACEQGTSLSKALQEEPATISPTVVPLVRAAEYTGDLPASLQSASGLIVDRIEGRARLIRNLAPPILFLIIASFVVTVPTALVASPMVSLIQGLSGGPARPGPLGAPAATGFTAVYAANLILLLPLAISLSFSRRMVYGDKRIGDSTWLESMLRLVEVLCWTFAALGYLFFALTPFSLLLLIVAKYVVATTYFSYYGSERDALLATLSFSARRFAPLTDSAWSRYVERGDRLGRKCIRLAESLAQGVTLPLALRAAGIRLPAPQRIALESADAAGDLGETLSIALERQTSMDREIGPIAAKFAYCGAIVMVMAAILTFIMLKIVPVFARMFEEFDLPLPGATTRLVEISQTIVAHSGAIILLIMVGTIVMGILFDDRIFRLFATLFPPLHWLRLRQYGAWLLRGLATLVRRNRPIAPAISVLADRYPIFTVGKLLQLAARRIEQGEPWTTVLQQYRFLSAYDAAFLAAAQRNGHLAWALDEAADNIERRRVLRLRYRANLFFPLAIVMLGAVTAFVFISLFMPLIALIQGLSGSR